MCSSKTTNNPRHLFTSIIGFRRIRKIQPKTLQRRLPDLRTSPRTRKAPVPIFGPNTSIRPRNGRLPAQPRPGHPQYPTLRPRSHKHRQGPHPVDVGVTQGSAVTHHLGLVTSMRHHLVIERRQRVGGRACLKPKAEVSGTVPPNLKHATKPRVQRHRRRGEMTITVRSANTMQFPSHSRSHAFTCQYHRSSPDSVPTISVAGVSGHACETIPFTRLVLLGEAICIIFPPSYIPRHILYILSSTTRHFNFRDLASQESEPGTISGNCSSFR